jgi:uncharacterized protein YjbI with pentapeptide repeats
MGENVERPTSDEDREGWKVYWAAQGMSWRTEPEIGEGRQRFLMERTQTKVNIGQGSFPFRDVPLVRADIEWLTATYRAVKPLDLRGANLWQTDLSQLPMGNLQGCLDSLIFPPLTQEQRANAAINLEGTNLRGAQLTGAKLRDARLQSAILVDAVLDGADLSVAHLEGADLRGASLRKVNLGGTYQAAGQTGDKQGPYVAHLEGANLSGAHLEEANLHAVRLEGASLQGAHLEAADLSNAHLQGVDLRRVVFSKDSKLDSIKLGDRQYGTASLGDIQWNGVDLTVLDWHTIRRLGDEKSRRRYAKPLKEPPEQVTRSTARPSPVEEGSHATSNLLTLLVTYLLLLLGLWAISSAFSSWWSPSQHLEAARANRRLALALREQGIIEADHFAYRAQVCQRGVLFRRLHGLRWLFSWLMDSVAGYGYKPLRSVVTYALCIATFALLYWCVTNDISLTHGLFTQALAWLGMSPPPAATYHLQGYEAVVVSMTSFHGRGFFQPSASPGDKVAILSAIEAAVGLLVEIIFIATFTQRFFAR